MRFWRCLRPGLYAILLAPKVAVGCRCDPYREYNLKEYCAREDIGSGILSGDYEKKKALYLYSKLFVFTQYLVLSSVSSRNFEWCPHATSKPSQYAWPQTFHIYNASFFAKEQKLLCISFALAYSIIVYYKRFRSYWARPIYWWAFSTNQLLLVRN